ncbi:MAG: hypothetical protein ILA11_07815 [Butyrivibrio sp.]|nr:hypothetical protein [Butyrivibrio sp.]
MAYDIWYTLRNNRLRQGLIEGFDIKDGNRLILDPEKPEHFAFLRPIDGVDDGSLWGRLTCDMLLSEEIVCYSYIIALDYLNVVTGEGESVDLDTYLFDPEIDTFKKVTLLTNLGAKRVVNTPDTLLYDLKGRYLIIAIEILGTGSVTIGNLRVGARGDNFTQTFPEVYQERNSFFHRYMSIFSSIFNDYGEENERLYEMLDLDKCSADLLEMYGSWFGIDLKGGFLPENILRNIVKEAYQLNRMKGTKWVIQRLLEMMELEDFVILENRLTGGEVFDVTILIKEKLTEELRHQIMFLLDQFRPVRTKIRLLQMQEDAVMDSNSYLDMNATIPGEKHVVLDEEAIYDGAITLL